MAEREDESHMVCMLPCVEVWPDRGTDIARLIPVHPLLTTVCVCVCVCACACACACVCVCVRAFVKDRV